jgi:hypothetical protein
MKKFLAVVLLTALVTGCASTPKTRFSEFYARPDKQSMDVVIDTLVLSDIAGSAAGYNKEKNDEAMKAVETAVTKAFADRGYDINIVYAGSGLIHQKKPDAEYYISEDWRSTDIAWHGPAPQGEQDLWATAEGTQFLQRLLARAHDANKQSSSRRKQPEPPISQDEIPQWVHDLESDFLVLVSAQGIEVSAGKSVGQAVATGLISALLTGGMYIHTSYSVSRSDIDIAVLDLTAEPRVVWHNHNPKGPGYKSVGTGINLTLKQFPEAQPNHAKTLESASR